MDRFAYVGCRTTKERGARGRGIQVFKIHDSGKWTRRRTVGDLVNPSYLCMDRTEHFLYTIHGDFSEITSFSMDRETGELTRLNTVSTGGTNPVHLSVDASNRWVFVANLQTGTVAVIPRMEDGTLGERKHLYTIPGVKTGDVSHPHQVAQDETGAYLIVSCQGRKAGFGQVVVFRIHWETGELEKTCTVRSREIAEPRHFVMCPGNRFGYGVNEKDYSVTCYEFDAAQGLLTPKQILPTLPDTYTGDGWASGIVMDPLGEYVVVSNRKHDSLTSFRIDPETGMLTFADCVKTGGQQPRFITVSTGDNRILAANELSDTLVEFELDRRSGKLMPVGEVIHTESPVCVIFTRPS